jgi:indolepyruvate ferredoxin oxidoreductase
MLYVIRNFRFLRPVLPGYHREDKQLLQWYERVVDDFAYTDETSYQLYVDALNTVESVTGYAEIRWPKMEAARTRAEQLLAAARKVRGARQQKLAV